MKRLLLTTCACLALCTAAQAGSEIKMGILMGFTGPAESYPPHMATSAELAWKEASESGLLLDGSTITSVRGDTGCSDAAMGISAAERLVSSEGVVGIMGTLCSGAMIAISRGVTVPAGVAMISPAATSPAISALEDHDLSFRTVPSDARVGPVLADITIGRGIKTVAITYTNNDYGKGLATSFEAAFKERGGAVLLNAAHEDGKGDYAAEVGALAATGADVLVVFGYIDQGGPAIIRTSIETGAFEKFILGDGMFGDALLGNIGLDIEGAFGTQPGNDSEPGKKFVAHSKANGVEGDGPFRPESYDAAAVLALALQAAGSADRAAVAAKVRAVANAPGEKIYPGELAKALQILKDGGEIDYEGATGVEFDEFGDVNGSYRELEIKGGKIELIAVH